MEDLREQSGDVVGEVEDITAESVEEELEVVGEPMDKPVSVIRPDDIVEAYTEAYGDLRALKFSYRPLTSQEEARYLDQMSRTSGSRIKKVKIGRGRSKQVVERGQFSVEKLAAINWKLLADHVVDGEIYDGDGDKIDFGDADAWKHVAPNVIFDIVGEIAGLTQEATVQETEQITGL